MKLGVISDTHGSVKAWRAAMAGPLGGVDFLLHAGDFLYHGPRNPLPEQYSPRELAELINSSRVPILAARGNCDADIDQVLVKWPLQPQYAVAQFGDVRVIVSHGHLEDEDARLALATQYGAAIWVSGHTHVPALLRREGILLLNPGSVAIPKGDTAEGTAAVIDLHERRVAIVTLSGSEFAAQRIPGSGGPRSDLA